MRQYCGTSHRVGGELRSRSCRLERGQGLEKRAWDLQSCLITLNKRGAMKDSVKSKISCEFKGWRVGNRIRSREPLRQKIFYREQGSAQRSKRKRTGLSERASRRKTQKIGEPLLLPEPQKKDREVFWGIFQGSTIVHETNQDVCSYSPAELE